MARARKLPAKSKAPVADPASAVINNSLAGLIGALFPFTGAGNFGQQISQTDTLFINNRWYLLSNNRSLLSQLYCEHGIVQTLVDQPVDDAFSPGFNIKSGQLDPEDVDDLIQFAYNCGAIENLKLSICWKRLYGGGAILLITDQDPVTKLDITKLAKDSPIEFRPVDMWELYYNQSAIGSDPTAVGGLNINDEFFNYYGHRIHRSRVLIQRGKEAPSFIRPRLRGWGMSELERIVRTFNQYLKNQDVIFELLDEAKVDVYKMQGFNELLTTADGTDKVVKRLQAANMVKNFQNAITMDSKDEYEQKNLPFSGLGDILVQIRQGIAADLKMPMTKLFGISAAGFNSGEDDIENYNSMLESQIRGKCTVQLIELLKICCQIKFGFTPDDLKVEWKSLRILTAKEEEEVKDLIFKRVSAATTTGLCEPEEAKQSINMAGLLPVEIKENNELTPPDDPDADNKDKKPAPRKKGE